MDDMRSNGKPKKLQKKSLVNDQDTTVQRPAKLINDIMTGLQKRQIADWAVASFYSDLSQPHPELVVWDQRFHAK